MKLALSVLGISSAFLSGMIAPVSSIPVNQQVVEETTPSAGAPCFAWTYSWHAQKRMREHNISEDWVSDVVYQTCSRAVKQPNGNFRYVQRKLTVIMNPDGHVVTLWRR